jgi:hypothetical protein
MLVQRVVIYIFQKDHVGTPLPECVLSMSLYVVNWVWKGNVPAARDDFASCLRDRFNEEMSLRETVRFLPRRLVRVKYRNATNKHIGTNGLVRRESILRLAICEAAVAAFSAAPGLTNVALEILPSISSSVYASASHKSITALNQPIPGEGKYVLKV